VSPAAATVRSVFAWRPGANGAAAVDTDSDGTAHTDTMVLLRRLILGHIAPQRARLALALIFMLVSAAMTGLMAQLMEPVMDQVFEMRNRALVLPIAAGVFAAFLLRGLATYAHSILMNHIGQRIVADLQGRLYGHLLGNDLAFFHATTAGQLLSRVINDVTVMRDAMGECLTSMGKSALTLVVLVGVMFYQDWMLATGAFLAFPVAGLFVARMGKRMRRVSALTQEELGQFSTILNQTFQGIRHVKAYGMESHEQARVSRIIERMFSLIHSAFRTAAVTTPVTEMLSGVAIVTVIIYGGFRVIDGASTVGELMSFITAFLLAYEPLKRMSKLNARLQSGLAATERVFALIDTRPEILDRPDAAPLAVEHFDIRFEGVSFAYGPQAPALHTLSLVVPAGRTVALVGPSGAGKSTVLNLIPRFYDVDQGRVLVGGADIRSVTMASLRRHIALVSQEVALFDDTIRANIAYGRIDAGEEEIIAAARAAAAHDFITGLPGGYDTMVGEHGVKLSGGQRQRIAIARAMLRDAPILLLDEATSALDTESERLVQDALRSLRRGRTTLVIAHRLTTVIDADCIYVLDRGQVAESGTHAELLRLGGLYSRLYGLQANEGGTPA